MAIPPGSEAPDFTLQDAHGHYLTLSKMRGSRVILYFYPKDDTPGCTIEAKEFSDRYHEFARHAILVFGISRDSRQSHDAFAEKCSLTVPLLSDPDGKVSEAYGVLKEKTLYGKRVLGVERTTFLIDTDGRISRIWERIQPEGHAQQVLRELTS